MLIGQDDVLKELERYGIRIHGVLHIGAHECEELPFYEKMGLTKDQMVWIDGNQEKVQWAQQHGIPNVYHALITEEDDKEISFHITNNGQSSSILELGTHQYHHPHVHYIETRKERGITIDTFYKRNNLEMSQYNFWNFDIQGAELLALKGATEALEYPKAIYVEVNTEEVYKGCALMEELDRYLAVYGMKRVLTHLTEFNWGDALYLKVSSTN
jgi:hypothetical protein